MNCGIYTLTNTRTGDRYVGSSSDLKSRRAAHLSAIRCGSHEFSRIRKQVRQYGRDAFDFEIVETCDSRELLERERQWIERLQPTLNTNGVSAGRVARPLREKRQAVSVAFPASHANALDEIGEDEDRSRGYLIEQAVKEFLEKRGKIAAKPTRPKSKAKP